MISKRRQPKIRFIKDQDVNIYGHDQGATLEMTIPLDVDKTTLYEYFLDFVRGCGYHVDSGMELVEDAPDECAKELTKAGITGSDTGVE